MTEGPYDDDKVALHVYNFLQMIYCLLSIVGCSVAMICILIVWRSSQILIKLIFFIILTQLISCIVGFLASPVVGVDFTQSHNVCVIQGLIFIFVQKAGLMWIATITLCMALIASGHAESSLNRFHYLFHVICWGVASALSFPFIPHIARIEFFGGKLSTWCVVKGDWVIGSFFVPLVILFTFNFICIIYIMAKFSSNYSETQEVYTKLLATRSKPKIRKFFLRLALIPVIFVFCYTGDIIYRVLLIMKEPISLPFLFVTEFLWLEGFLFALVYLGKKRFIKRLGKACCKSRKQSPTYSFS
eukprot:Phypoly_transcript_12870.p1 GENE.Phypoly_transcript_12870~~Phypoly_transcript_12870.p1  ORF type:complete len:301 (+),score=13.86 Phypoly_transcript_12870:111-1013(+)